jgi:hypothetical protein
MAGGMVHVLDMDQTPKCFLKTAGLLAGHPGRLEIKLQLGIQSGQAQSMRNWQSWKAKN